MITPIHGASAQKNHSPVLSEEPLVVKTANVFIACSHFIEKVSSRSCYLIPSKTPREILLLEKKLNILLISFSQSGDVLTCSFIELMKKSVACLPKQKSIHYPTSNLVRLPKSSRDLLEEIQRLFLAKITIPIERLPQTHGPTKIDKVLTILQSHHVLPAKAAKTALECVCFFTVTDPHPPYLEENLELLIEECKKHHELPLASFLTLLQKRLQSLKRDSSIDEPSTPPSIDIAFHLLLYANIIQEEAKKVTNLTQLDVNLKKLFSFLRTLKTLEQIPDKKYTSLLKTMQLVKEQLLLN